MKTFQIQVPDEIASKIERAAEERGISVDELLRASVAEKIERDSRFEHAVGRVLEKNAELYRRLS
jgi:predicted transcriptional regulator